MRHGSSHQRLGVSNSRPLVIAAERTFWEKPTAAHVYCPQGKLRGERYARHWYDLVAIAKSAHFEKAMGDRVVAKQVAEHKSMYFAEKDAAGSWVDYFAAVSGELRLIPEGNSLQALADDYDAMLEDGLLSTEQPMFSEILASCNAIQTRVNSETPRK